MHSFGVCSPELLNAVRSEEVWGHGVKAGRSPLEAPRSVQEGKETEKPLRTICF